MTIEMNGKPIKRIWWCAAEGDASITAMGSRTLELSATFHGDRDEFWVIQKEDGKEVARHNCRTIATIDWA